MTSVYLREVCCALLDTKGCVTLQWERLKRKNGQLMANWTIAHKRWFFSTSLGPIDHWSFAAQEAVSDHMKVCPFNVRTQHKKPEKIGEMEWSEVRLVM